MGIKGQFLAQFFMDAFEVVYPRYWLWPELEMRFVIILAILKVAICQLKKVGFNKEWLLGLFSIIVLDLNMSMFILTMKKNVKLMMQKPFNIDSLTKLWKTFSSFQILEQKTMNTLGWLDLVSRKFLIE